METVKLRTRSVYEKHAAAWDAQRGRSLFEKAWLDRLLARTSPGDSILDVGCGSYGRFWVTRLDQAARFRSPLCWATPSVNLTPSMTRGNWFVPLSLRHFLDAALTRVKTMSLAVFWGDIVHVPNIQIQRPDVTLDFDSDAQAAAAMRRRVFDMAVSDRMLVGGMHLDFPGFGYLGRQGNGYRYFPEPWKAML